MIATTSMMVCDWCGIRTRQWAKIQIQDGDAYGYSRTIYRIACGNCASKVQYSKGSIADENTSVSRKIFKGTREEYLMAGKKELSKLFKQAGHTVPKDVKVTMSLPTKNARPSKIQTIGQCFARSASDGGINEILITPLLNNSVDVLAVLTHELVHAIDDCENGHKTPFKRIAEAVGLEGKMTNTKAGAELTEKIKAIVKKLGRYPHKKLNLGGKKQTTRNLPILCTNYDFHGDKGQPWRTTQKIVDGSPLSVQEWFCNGCAEFGFMIPLFANCEGELIALTETRTSWGNEYTYPANKLARQFAEISGQKTLSAYTISRMESMGVKVMNELEYYKQQAGVENCEGEVDLLIKPKENYKLLGTGIRLNKEKVYKATLATNQPNYKKLGLIFADDVLLNRDEYEVVS